MEDTNSEFNNTRLWAYVASKKQEILMVAEVLFYLQKMNGGPLPSTDHGNDLKYTEFHSMILDIVCAHFESSLPFYMLYQIL